MRQIQTVVWSWLPLAVLSTVLPLLVYLAVQQNYRQSANDPQIQLAEDGAMALAAGRPAQALMPSAAIDLASSLAPFIVVYTTDGKVIASSGQLHGQTPALPAGVLPEVATKGERRFTWQPEPGVRLATVVSSYRGNNPGFVLAARSLREVERREDNLALIAGLAMICLLTTTFAFSFVSYLRRPEQ